MHFVGPKNLYKEVLHGYVFHYSKHNIDFGNPRYTNLVIFHKYEVIGISNCIFSIINELSVIHTHIIKDPNFVKFGQ